MTYSCTEPLCRWAAFNGQHPTLPHAVWWGCTPRPRRPFEPGDPVVHVRAPEEGAHPVERCEWDSGTGWHVVVRYRDDQWGTARHDPSELVLDRPSVGHVQPDIFELLGAMA